MLLFFRNSVPLLFVICLFSCQDYQEVQFQKVDDLKVVGVSDGEIRIKGTAVFFNPNKQGVKLRKAEVDIFHKDKKVASLEPRERVKIKGRDTFEVPVDARINLKDSGLLKNVLALLGKKNIELEYRGYIIVSSWMISKKIEINDKQTLKF